MRVLLLDDVEAVDWSSANQASSTLLHKRSHYARAEAGDTSWQVTRRGPNHPTFQGRLGRIALPKESHRRRISAPEPTPARPRSRRNLIWAFERRSGSRREGQEGRDVPKLRRPTSGALETLCRRQDTGEGRHVRPAKTCQSIEPSGIY